MRKRKITRASLDELAKIMPTLTEQEQTKYIGGTRFYSTEGIYLGLVGSSDILRIVDEQSFKTNLKFKTTDQDNAGYSLKSAPRDILATFLKGAVGSDIGFTGNIYPVRSGTASQTGPMGFNAPDKFFLNIDDSIVFTNYYAFRSALEHEKSHYNTSSSSGIWNRDDPNHDILVATDELKAYSAQVNGTYFKNAPKEYKKMTAQYWYQNVLIANPNISQQEKENAKKNIATKCGINANDF